MGIPTLKTMILTTGAQARGTSMPSVAELATMIVKMGDTTLLALLIMWTQKSYHYRPHWCRSRPHGYPGTTRLE
jgi:hypothetical protein